MKKITEKSLPEIKTTTYYQCDRCGAEQSDRDFIFNCPKHGEFCFDCEVRYDKCFFMCPDCEKKPVDQIVSGAEIKHRYNGLFRLVKLQNHNIIVVGDSDLYRIVEKGRPHEIITKKNL